LANLGDLRAAVLDNLERAASDSIAQASNVNRWINHAVRYVLCTRHNWDSMERTYSVSLVAGQDLYAYPSLYTKDVKQVALRLDSTSPYFVLREDSEGQLDEDLPKTLVNGVPISWCRSGTSIRLRPTPSVSTFGIRARFFEYPMPLVTDADANYFTNEQEDLVEDIATAYGFRWLGSMDRYQALLGVAMQEMDLRINNDAKRLRPKRMTVAPGRAAGRAQSSAGTRFGDDYYRMYPP
jgi:hypothetical protein